MYYWIAHGFIGWRWFIITGCDNEDIVLSSKMLFVIPAYFLSAPDRRNDHQNDHQNPPLNHSSDLPCQEYSQRWGAVDYGVNAFYKQKYIEGSLAKPLNQRIVRPHTNGYHTQPPPTGLLKSVVPIWCLWNCWLYFKLIYRFGCWISWFRFGQHYRFF